MHFRKTLLSGLVTAVVCAGAFVSTAALADRHETHDPNAILATHGVSAGDVTANSAVIWSRADRAGTMHVQLLGRRHDDGAYRSVPVTAEDDFTGKVQIDGLKPGTEYRYRVWFSDEREGRPGKDRAVEGSFRTAPAAQDNTAVHLAWGGDLAGQNTCRDATEGFPIFSAINAERPDFFIGLGDMIYADGTCDPVGRYGNAQIPGDFPQAFDMDSYWAHWKYNREDTGYRMLLASTPYYAIWDDHEVVNDFGPLHDTRSTAPYTPGVHLMPMGLDAFLDYNPIAENAETPKRLYRSIRWGKQMEMFILDTRQYRDANFAADSSAQPKSMLGREQLVWLKEQLQRSDATWKIIVSSVPMAIPTGSSGAAGRDGWGNYLQDGGFEQELLDVLRFMQQNGMYNVAFLTTDVHFAEVFRFTPFSDDPAFQVHEIVAGPVNAGVFPNRSFDDTLNPEILSFFGAGSAAEVTTWEQAKSWFNYGSLQIDENGRMTASIKNVEGESVYSISVDAK